MSEHLAWWAIGACLLMVPTIRSWAAANRRYAAAVERATAAVQATMSPAVAVQLAKATARAEAAEAEAERLRTALDEVAQWLTISDPGESTSHRAVGICFAALGHETEETPDAQNP